MTLNLDCYKYEKIIFNKGLLDESVDATYIIHLEGNGRLPAILEQINKYKPTKLVYILFNKGFKKCKKQPYIKKSPADLIDANLQIFKHANQQNYNNILILEDDFFFEDKIKDPTVLDRVNKFIKARTNTIMLYTLGCLPMIMVPYDKYHYYGFFGATHACIFTKLYRNNILKKEQSNLRDWDTVNPLCYTYYEPLCFQLFPNTENQKNWIVTDNNSFENLLYNICGKNMLLYTRLTKLDKQHRPGYNITYAISKILFWLIIAFLIFVIYIIMQKYYN